MTLHSYVIAEIAYTTEYALHVGLAWPRHLFSVQVYKSHQRKLLLQLPGENKHVYGSYISSSFLPASLPTTLLTLASANSVKQ